MTTSDTTHPSARRCRIRPVAAFLVSAQAALVVAALSVPLSLTWVSAHSRRPGAQHSIAAQGVVVAAEALASTPALMVLAYHNIEPHPHSPYALTPQQFADQMRALVAAGYTSASTSDVTTLLAGRTVPGHRVLITFDDGAKGIWTYADPVLARYHLRATAFIITGQVGKHQPYYVTWEELRAMQDTGRWDLESHTHLGHGLIPIDGRGGRGPFLTNRAWLPRQGRSESQPEYVSRITTDLAQSKMALTAHHLPTPRYFAFPFSATGYPANDSAIPALLRKVLQSQFTASFVNAADATALTPQNLATRELPRIEVRSVISPADLLGHLLRAAPRAPGEAHLNVPTDWCCMSETANISVDATGRYRVLGAEDPGWRLSTYGPSEVAQWTRYTLTATAQGLKEPGQSMALIVRTDRHAGVRVVVGRGAVRLVQVNNDLSERGLARAPLPARDRHQLQITVTDKLIEVTVDATTRLAFRGAGAGGVGLGIFRTPTGTDLWWSDVRVS